jgi:putative sugar O-methyltransferase
MELVPAPGNYFGCSALSLVNLAEKKGYKLVAVTDSNCLFVAAPDFPRFADYETSLPRIAVTRHLTHLITGYAGDYLLSREPTYGCGASSAQKFAQGEPFFFPPAAPAAPAVSAPKPEPKLGEKVRKKMGALFRNHKFNRLSREAKELHAGWEKDFSPVAGQFVHPVWQKARPAFASLIQDGVPGNFLNHSEVVRQFCRSGFGEPQQHELNYLLSRPRELRDLVDRYRESNAGGPVLECGELQISANSLAMLYYFVRIAEQSKLGSLHTIAEFGGGYGCLCRVFLELLPVPPTYVILDLPEMLTLQDIFLKASSPAYKVVPHRVAPLRLEAGAVHLLPVHLAGSLAAQPNLFISTFALSETPARLQEQIAQGRFFASHSVYLVGQETDAQFWQHAGLDSPKALHRAVHECFSQVRLQPYHFAHAWELFACDRKDPPTPQPVARAKKEMA